MPNPSFATHGTTVNSVDEHVRREIRKARRTRWLGDGDSCVSCGTDREEALRRVDLDKLDLLRKLPVVGDEHLVGRHNDLGMTARFCRNCQAVYTERQRDFEVNLTKDTDRDPIDKLEALLRGLAATFLHVVESLFEVWLVLLLRFRRFLDDNYPDWQQKWVEWQATNPAHD